MFSWYPRETNKNRIMKLGERGVEFRGIHWAKVELAPLEISVEWVCPLISYWALILSFLARPFTGIHTETDRALKVVFC